MLEWTNYLTRRDEFRGQPERRPNTWSTRITFWDTANVYGGGGTSEEIVGRALTAYTRREDIVLATKVFFPMHQGPGGAGLSRRAILEQIDASLNRLGTDYVDLYQIHRFDPDAPVEETMEALHDVVKAGKARYVGASSMWAWQFARCSTPPSTTGGPHHLADAAAAVDIHLSDDEIRALEEHYTPRQPTYFS